MLSKRVKLTSISKHYGVSMYAIAAANKNIADIDLVFEGQHLNIPLADKNVFETQRSWAGKFKLPLKDQSWMKILSGVLAPKSFSLLYSHFVPRAHPWYYQARTVSCFLVLLIPLLAFYIRCMIDAFRQRASGKFLHKTANESDVKHLRSQGGRWRSALGVAWELERTDADSIPDSPASKTGWKIQMSNRVVLVSFFCWLIPNVVQPHSEDQDQISLEEEAHAYRKLEHDYQELLTQCGMGKWGYWRDGSPR